VNDYAVEGRRGVFVSKVRIRNPSAPHGGWGLRETDLGQAEERRLGVSGQLQRPACRGHELHRHHLQYNSMRVSVRCSTGTPQFNTEFNRVLKVLNGDFQRRTMLSTGGMPAPVPCAPTCMNPPTCKPNGKLSFISVQYDTLSPRLLVWSGGSS
jgi:hypothetical protein